MARALVPARLDNVGWYLEGSDVDLSRGLNRFFEDLPHGQLVERIAERLPDINNAGDAPGASPVNNEAMDLDDRDSGSVGSKLESPVESYYFIDEEDSLTSLFELQLDGDSEPGKHQTLVLYGKKSSSSFNREVNSWRVEFDQVPVLFVKDMEDNWLLLKDPLTVYDQIESELRLLEYLCAIKQRVHPSPTLSPEILQAHSDLLNKLVARDADLRPPLEPQRKRKANDDEAGPSKRLKVDEVVEEDAPEQMDDEMGNGLHEDSGEETELGESICAVCDDGGDLLCCDGPCLRSFHGDCLLDVLKVKVPYAHLKQSSFYCRNCSEHQHQCFACGRLGLSRGSSAEVFLCDVAFCGRFYHRDCVSKLLGNKNVEHGFVCPQHACFKCGQGEVLYECRRCPRAWHEKCADERILFEEKVGEKRRGWILGKTRFLYCMQHSIDPTLNTPKRNHLAFPPVRQEARIREPSPLQFKSKRVSSNELRAIQDPVLAIMEETRRTVTKDTVSQKLSRPQTVGSAPSELCHMNMIASQVNAVNRSLSYLANGGTVEEARRICPVGRFKKFRESMKVYLSPLLYGMRYSTFGRHFTVREKLQAVVDRLCWYISPGDTVADLCCGANEFSRLLSTKMAAMNFPCRFKNYDIIQPIDTFCFERRDFTTIKSTELPEPEKLIIGLNPPFGVNAHLASKFAKLAATFRPKIIILIAPKETMRLEALGYDLVWEDKRLLEGNAFYFPGSVDATGRIISHENHDVPYLFLWSRRDWRVTHERIAKSKGHDFGVEELGSLDHVVTEGCADSQRGERGERARQHHRHHETRGDVQASPGVCELKQSNADGDKNSDDESSPQREGSEVVEEEREEKSPNSETSEEESLERTQEKPRNPPQQEGRLGWFDDFPRQQMPRRGRRPTSRASSRDRSHNRVRSCEPEEQRSGAGRWHRGGRSHEFEGQQHPYGLQGGVLGAPPGYEDYFCPPPAYYQGGPAFYGMQPGVSPAYPPYDPYHPYAPPPPPPPQAFVGPSPPEFHYRQPFYGSSRRHYNIQDGRFVQYEDHFRGPGPHGNGRYFYR